MNTGNIIKALNLTDGEILTLEKAADRIEFEALPIMILEDACKCNGSNCDCDGKNCGLHVQI